MLAAAKAASYLRGAVSYFVYAVKARYDYIFGDLIPCRFRTDTVVIAIASLAQIIA